MTPLVLALLRLRALVSRGHVEPLSLAADGRIATPPLRPAVRWCLYAAIAEAGGSEHTAALHECLERTVDAPRRWTLEQWASQPQCNVVGLINRVLPTARIQRGQT